MVENVADAPVSKTPTPPIVTSQATEPGSHSWSNVVTRPVLKYVSISHESFSVLTPATPPETVPLAPWAEEEAGDDVGSSDVRRLSVSRRADNAAAAEGNASKDAAEQPAEEGEERPESAVEPGGRLVVWRIVRQVWGDAAVILPTAPLAQPTKPPTPANAEGVEAAVELPFMPEVAPPPMPKPYLVGLDRNTVLKAVVEIAMER